MRHTRSTLVRILGNASISLIGCALFFASSPFAQAQTIYAITQSGIYGTLNVSTGAFTPITSPGFEPAGLAGLGANLFSAVYPGNTLYEVNLTNGNFVTIGNGSATYYDFGSTTAGLYGFGTDQNLYSVNSSTGATTLIGPTGLPSGGLSGMSGGGPALYLALATENDSLLYLVNTTTGAATEIGNTGVSIAALGFADGTLYAADTSGNIYTVNTSTGAVTLISNCGQVLYGLGLPPMTYSVLHNFTGGLDGSNPFAGLTMDSSGNLYGTAGAGGNGSCSYSGLTGCGTVFKIAHSVFTFAPLYSFHGGTDGEFSARPLTIGSNGSLYGATLGGGEGTCTFDGDTGCGVVFNVTPSPTFPRTPLQPWLETLKYSFTGESDGGVAFTTVLFDSSGNIYGTTIYGGANGVGAVFKLTPSGGGNYTESVLYSFAGGSDGENPHDGLIADSSGNLYGTTDAGGGSTHCTYGCGTVFKLTLSDGNYTESVLYSFSGPTDGENPNAGVVMDLMGNLYGNTWQGGPGGGGKVYELLYPNWTFSLLHSFVGNGYSLGRMALDSSGNLYGVLQNGGAFNNAGQVYELTPSNGAWYLTDFYDFTGGGDGGNPIGGVLRDSSGNLYGTTLFGGANNTCGSNGSTSCGVVVRIVPN